MIPKKEHGKKLRKAPKGFKTANDFFEELFLDEDLIWMGQNTNHLHDENFVRDAMIKAVESKDYCKYPPPEGLSELKELVLKDLDLEDMDLVITAGATTALYYCMSDLLSPNDNVISPDPGYLIIDNFASRFAKEVKSIPIYNEECGYKLTPDLVKENIDENTGLIILIDPLNPLGGAYTEDEIKEFAKIAKDNDLFLLHDITYRDFSRKHYLAANYAPENTITVYSFSKIFGMAVIRVGALVSTHEVMNSVRQVLIDDFGTNVIAQYGAIEALKSKPDWIDYVKDTTFNNQKIIKDAVDECDGVFIVRYPSDANMLAIDLSGANINPKDMSKYLLERNVFTREGQYTSKKFGDKYLRVSFSVPPEDVKVFADEFKKAVEVLRK